MRSILIVLDSLGVGAAPDAERDRGADTLGHLFAHTPELELPALFSMGLGHVLAGNGEAREGLRGSYGRVRLRSPGNDSMSGHWEMAGVILNDGFATYERLPPQLVEGIAAKAGVEFLLATDRGGNRKKHEVTGRPIIELMPGESAIEISAHEALVPRRRLYEIGRIARRVANGYRIARVIAQPLTGKPGGYVEGKGRHEYPMAPPRTVLNAISEAGLVVEGIGKVPDLFGRSGVTHAHAAKGNAEAVAAIERVWERMHDGLIFANLAEFDGLGHGRDVAGYAGALVDFDKWLAGFLPHVGRDDLLIITADHGNDPAYRDAGHTREEVPLLAHYDGVTGSLGTRETLADVAATLAEFFRLRERWKTGEPFLDFSRRKKVGNGLRR